MKIRYLYWISLIFFAVIFKMSFQIKPTGSPYGTFWHITDIHVDQNYSRTGDVTDLCHEHSSRKEKDNGLYGNFFCDSPEILVNVTVQAMKELKPDPDFIIWTGDNVAHTRPNPDWNVVFAAIQNVTAMLKSTFPKAQIFPTIGNHDTFPANVLEAEYSGRTIYDDYLDKGGWKNILPENTLSTFHSGGFYSHIIKPGLWIISLNTILWYETNYLTANISDPAGQLKWLKDELGRIDKTKEKVYIIGHVPPGYYNRVEPGTKSDPMYHPQFLRSYLTIIKDYSSIILGQMFGHLHYSMFQLYFCDTGMVHGSSILSSSVTPWYHISYDNDTRLLPVNPSVRLMLYDKNSGILKNYLQYYLNLTEANSLKFPDKPKYELLYTFTEAYEVPDITTSSLLALYERMKSSSHVFQLFYKYLTAGKLSTACDSECKRAQLCSIACTSATEYGSCMQKNDVDFENVTDINHTNDESYKSYTVTYIVLIVCITLLLICITLIILYKKKLMCWKNRNYQYFSSF